MTKTSLMKGICDIKRHSTRLPPPVTILAMRERGERVAKVKDSRITHQLRFYTRE